jgi:hypothetical protein
MLSFLSNIMSGIQQSRSYRQQASLLRKQGKLARAKADTEAANIMRTADANWQLNQQKRIASRQNQTNTLASVRTARANSGFTNQGTHAQAEASTASALDEAIANMAQSASIQYANAFNASNATKLQGKLQQSALKSQAKQYSIAAKATQEATLVSGIVGGAGAVAGFISGAMSAQSFNTANAAAIESGALQSRSLYANGALRASQFAGDFSNASMSLNPFTSSLTRKNNWGSLTSIMLGNTPGYQNSEFSL